MIFVMGGLAGGYYMAGNQHAMVGEAQAGDCVNVIRQCPGVGDKSLGYSCGYFISFDKKPDHCKVSSNAVVVYFK